MIDTGGSRSGDASGTRSASDGDEGVATPEALRVAVYSATAAGLAWARGARGVVAYEVRRNGSLLGTSDDPTYIDSTLEGGLVFRYEVVAVDAAGRRSAPASILVRTAPAPVEPLAPPAGLRLTRYSDTALGLGWTRSPIPGLRYEVTRDDRLVALTDGTSHVDRDLVATGTYVYAVRTVGPDGRRSVPASVIVRPSGPPPTPRSLRARIYSPTALELFWYGGKDFRAEIRRDGVPIGMAGFGYSYADFDVTTPVPLYEVVFVGADGARSAPAQLLIDMSTPEREAGAFGAGPDPSPRPPPSTVRFPPTAAPALTPGGDADLTTARLFGDIDVRLEGEAPFNQTLFWDRVPNAARYRIESEGLSRDVAVEQIWTSLFLRRFVPAPRYTVTALDAGGGVLARTSLLVESRFSPRLFPPGDSLGDASVNRFAQASPAGRTTLERLGFDAARELADDLLTGRYLELYFEAAATVDMLVAGVVRDYFLDPGRLAGNLADDGGLPAVVACPGGGRITVETLEAEGSGRETVRSRLAFDACALADRTLSGRLRREVRRVAAEPDDRLLSRRIELDAFGVDAGSRGRFVASGTAERSTETPGEETCEDGIIRRYRSLTHQLVQGMVERDGIRHVIQQSSHFGSTLTQGAIDEGGACRSVEIHRRTGDATVRSSHADGPTMRLSRSVESNPFILSRHPAGQFKADFGDGSRFAISWFENGDEARVDLLSGDDVVSFRDTVPF